MKRIQWTSVFKKLNGSVMIGFLPKRYSKMMNARLFKQMRSLPILVAVSSLMQILGEFAILTREMSIQLSKKSALHRSKQQNRKDQLQRKNKQKNKQKNRHHQMQRKQLGNNSFRKNWNKREMKKKNKQLWRETDWQKRNQQDRPRRKRSKDLLSRKN